MKARCASAIAAFLLSTLLAVASSCARPADPVTLDDQAHSSSSALTSDAVDSAGSDGKEDSSVAAETAGPESVTKQVSAVVAGVHAGDDEPVQAGIGAALDIQDGQVLISKVLPSTPAAQTDVFKPGDQIVAVGQGDEEPVNVEGMKLTEVVGMIRGAVGTTVRLTISPAGSDTEKHVVVSLVRGAVKALNTFGDGTLLPVGATAPNFAFTRLPDGESGQLSQFAGQIVVLEFWATWCGPCIQTLDKLDALRAEHPEWRGQVELVAASVNEKKDDVTQFLEEKNWSSVSTVWAGEKVLKSYHVSGLGALFVIDREGKVIACNRVVSLPELIKRLLRTSAS